jgi:hypothetical protein
LAKLTKEDAVAFVHNAHRFWEQPDVLQAVWNLRDKFKAWRSVRRPSGDAGATLPTELQSDVLVADEPLPNVDELHVLVARLHEEAELPAPDEETIGHCVDALIGLAAFPAEQVLAMSLSKKGVDVDLLWDRKRQAVEQTPGLSIWRGGETFDDIGGWRQHASSS